MGTFVLAEGEIQLAKWRVTAICDGKRIRNSRLVMTDRRVVLLTQRSSSFLWWLFMVTSWLFLIPLLMSTWTDATEIAREKFDTVEEADGTLAFRSKGSGYAQTAFHLVALSPAREWPERMRAWSDGRLEARALL
jgi:hypothetical protein